MKLRNILFAVVWLAPMFAHADANDGDFLLSMECRWGGRRARLTPTPTTKRDQCQMW